MQHTKFHVGWQSSEPLDPTALLASTRGESLRRIRIVPPRFDPPRWLKSTAAMHPTTLRPTEAEWMMARLLGECGYPTQRAVEVGQHFGLLNANAKPTDRAAEFFWLGGTIQAPHGDPFTFTQWLKLADGYAWSALQISALSEVRQMRRTGRRRTPRGQDLQFKFRRHAAGEEWPCDARELHGEDKQTFHFLLERAA